MTDTSPKITYVPRAAEAVWTGPSDFQNVTLYGFVVKADSALLDETLNRYIDRPSVELGRRIAVRTSFDRALFIFVDSERVQRPLLNAAGRAGSTGLHGEQLFAVVVFGSRTQPDPAPIVYAPYVYASMSPGWRVEREIFGYPQQLGNIAITPGQEVGLPAQVELKANAIETFEPEAIANLATILKIERNPAAMHPDRWVEAPDLARAIAEAIAPAGAMADDEGSIAAPRQFEPMRRGRDRWRRRHRRPKTSTARFGVTAADESFSQRCPRESSDEEPEPNARESAGLPTLADSGEPRPGRQDLEETLRSGRMRMLFLKQFRDVVHADRACYQAIVEAAICGTGLTGAWVSEDYRLTLHDLDSAPIKRELGVPRESDVVLAFRVNLDKVTIGTDTPGTVISNPHWSPAQESSDPDERSRLPKYVERGAEAVWRQPSLLFGMRIYGFGIQVPIEQQMATLDRYVNDIARNDPDVAYGRNPFRLVPCSGIDMVMLMFIDYRQVTSGTDDDRRLGGVRYREFLAMQLALCDDEDFPELDWLIPFIYLDKDSPRLGGREIFGYPKQLGTIPEFQRFVDGEAAKRLELQATVLPDFFAGRARESESIVIIEGAAMPETERQYDKAADMIEDLLKVRPSIQAGSRPGCAFPCEAAAAGGVAPGSLGAGVDILNAVVSGGVGHVFLKQFRDCEHPANACYQAVCKVDTVPGRFRGGARVNAKEYRIKISDLESERLNEYLGKSSDEWQNGVTPDFAYWMDLDAELTTGRVIANPLERGFMPDRSRANTLERRNRRRIRRSGEPAV